MSAADQKPDFTKIALKYKSLEAFAQAARTTFAKGRMTLKSKKAFNEGDRIILAVSIPERQQPVEIISEIIQKVGDGDAGGSATYGIRWLNFTEKKLTRLLQDPAGTKEMAPPPKTREKPAAAAPAKKKAPPPKKPAAQAAKPVDEDQGFEEDYTIGPGEEEAYPSFAEPAKAGKPASDISVEEEYTIEEETSGSYPSFQEPSEVIIPPAPEEEDEGFLEDAFVDGDKARKTELPDDGFDAGAEVDTSLDVQPVPPKPKPKPQPKAPKPQEPEKAPLPPPPPRHQSELESETGAPQPPGSAPMPPPPPRHQSELEGEPGEAQETGRSWEDEFMNPGAAGQEKTGAPQPSGGSPLPPPPPRFESELAEGTTLPKGFRARDDLEDEEILEAPATAHEVPPPEEPLPPVKVLKKPISKSELSALGAFLLKFLRLALQPDKIARGEASENVNALYEEFKSVMAERDEIGIYVRSAGKVREFMLAGDLLDPVNLKAEMEPAVFDELALKLVDFFKTKRLVGLQFRRYLTDEAFRKFVLLMGRYNPSSSSPEDLASNLLREGVFHASPVHFSDRLAESEGLDFRVDSTLTRLRGDIVRLQLVAEAIMEDPLALMTLRAEDALKALQSGRLRADLLLHIRGLTAGQDLISEQDLVQEIILATPIEMIIEGCQYMADVYEKTSSLQEQNKGNQKLADRLERVRYVLRRVTARLMGEDPDAAGRVMGGLYRKGVFTLEELPMELREQVMLEQFIDFFLSDPDKRLSDFSGIRTEKDYRNSAQRYVRMVGELARRGDIDRAQKIFQVLVDHVRNPASDFPERQRTARDSLGVLSKPRVMEGLIRGLAKADKSKRDKLAAMIYAAGPKGAGTVLDSLGKEEDRSLRKVMCEVITRLGEPVAPMIMQKVKDPASPWYLVRNLVMVLADMKNPAATGELDWLVKHDQPQVREEALIYAAKVMGADSEAMLTRSLSDPDPVVRRRALRILSRFPELGDATILKVTEMVETKPPEEISPEQEQALVAAAELLGKTGKRSLPSGKSLEEVLISVIESQSGKGLLGRISGSKPGWTPKVRAALVEALGKAGTGKAKKLLSSLAKDKDQTVKQSAQAALTRLGGA